MLPVHSQKAHPIDLNADYPCPCRRRGRLMPIVLTEAFGCDRCQQIFVVEEGRQAIEELSVSHSYKRVWRWTGQRWIIAHPSLKESYLPLALGMVAIGLAIWLPLALRSSSSSNVALWAAIAVLLAILPALMVWLAYRR